MAREGPDREGSRRLYKSIAPGNSPRGVVETVPVDVVIGAGVEVVVGVVVVGVVVVGVVEAGMAE